MQDEAQKRGDTDPEREYLCDLLEDIMERIQEFREEILTELDDLEDLIAENSGKVFH